MSSMDNMATSRKGLRLLLAGFLVMVAGYILMTGGGSDDPNVFNYAMFDFRRLYAAPLVIIAGIVTIVVAIMGNFKDKEER
ncbi:MAG: DUF3098 domain-containing protein [Bacteroidales bacterium]|nr:DUF3098 domain-containing protein [Bacteroidales bacterium]MDD6773734.1 DUF3098 domain-containing protein [Bacteroidales bacterium]